MMYMTSREKSLEYKERRRRRYSVYENEELIKENPPIRLAALEKANGLVKRPSMDSAS
ncbi:hypothetical protein [Enterocloster sp.]|uniref:hypothetical protein n=1 Tax=Enterocloster sp. TaxID=2719315 RepID=UPI0039A12D2C